MALLLRFGSLVTQCSIFILLTSDTRTNAFSIGKLRKDGLAVDTGQDMTAQESSTYIININQNDSDKRVLDYLNNEFRNNTTATNLIETNKPGKYESKKVNSGENITEPVKTLEAENQLVNLEHTTFSKEKTDELTETSTRNNEVIIKLNESGIKTATDVDSLSSYLTLPVRETIKDVEKNNDQSTLSLLHSDTEAILTTDAETPSKSEITELFPIKTRIDDIVLPESTPTWKRYTIIDRKNDQQDPATTNNNQLDALDTLNSFNFSENVQETRLQKAESQESSSLPSDLFEAKEEKFEDNHEPVSEVSKRGGFLDLTSRTTAIYTSTTESTTLLNKLTTTQSSPLVIKKSEFKKNRSQTQLSDDAIKEALMIEELHETLNNLAVSINKDETTQMNSLEITERTNILETTRVLESSTEDRLSVKPIGKNSSIYTVNPNYKPLKKLDVVPPKQFLRDPDDNSWRNESISSLGIVFNPKNASKPLTEVLKNKTESEFGYLIDDEDTQETPELRTRLEKLAEDRKNKKKLNKKGETNESDEMDLVLDYFKDVAIKTSQKPTTEIPFFERLFTVTDPTSAKPHEDALQKSKLKKTFKKLYDFYDNSDDDDDYATLANIDIKKSTTPLPKTPAKTPEKTAPEPLKPPPVEMEYVQPLRPQFPERKPSVQYFPPRGRPLLAKLDAVDDFQDKMIQYTFPDVIISSEMPTTKEVKTTTITTMAPFYINKNYYDGNADDNESPDAPYMIKQFKDSIRKAEKERQNDLTNRNFPMRTATPKTDPQKAKENFSLDLGKDIMERFFENYHENNEKFKVDYPVVFNNSVVHGKWPNGGLSLSRAFMKQAYGGVKKEQLVDLKKGYDPNCDKTVDLSPDYELHYYIPEQEEREEIEQKYS